MFSKPAWKWKCTAADIRKMSIDVVEQISALPIATYADYALSAYVDIGLIGKCVDFLLVLIELFSLGITAEALRAIIGSKSRFRSNGSRFSAEGVAPTNHSSSQKTRINDLSYGIKYKHIFLPFCHNARV